MLELIYTWVHCVLIPFYLIGIGLILPLLQKCWASFKTMGRQKTTSRQHQGKSLRATGIPRCFREGDEECTPTSATAVYLDEDAVLSREVSPPCKWPRNEDVSEVCLAPGTRQRSKIQGHTSHELDEDSGNANVDSDWQSIAAGRPLNNVAELPPADAVALTPHQNRELLWKNSDRTVETEKLKAYDLGDENLFTELSQVHVYFSRKRKQYPDKYPLHCKMDNAPLFICCSTDSFP